MKSCNLILVRDGPVVMISAVLDIVAAIGEAFASWRFYFVLSLGGCGRRDPLVDARFTFAHEHRGCARRACSLRRNCLGVAGDITPEHELLRCVSPKQSMKPIAPLRGKPGVLATTPWSGLSL